MIRAMLLALVVLTTVTAHAQTARQRLGVDLDPVKLRDPLAGKIRASQTSVDDQTEVAITVYDNFALVRDRRKVVLFPGEISLTFTDVAQRIRPETVSLRSVSDPGAIRILEQNYEYDLMSPSKLMEKYVGKQLRLVNFSTEIGFTEVDGELLSMNDGPIYKIGNEIFLGHPGTVVLPEIPENLIAKPSLIWLLDNRGTDQEIEITYLTGGMGWKADYVVNLAKDETQADIEAWVTLRNESGAPYVNARIKLVAGDVNVVQTLQPQMLRQTMVVERARQETFAEYHLYTLPRRTTLKENQSKQISLFKATGVRVAKEYEFRGGGFYPQPVKTTQSSKINVYLKIENAEDNNLGVPLPAGVMHIYQEDSEDMLQFAGEDRIGHTPTGETVRLRMGSAFDIVGERTQKDFRRISNNVIESSYEVKIRNHKETAISVDVVEAMGGDWEILDSSHPFTKKDARTALFALPVAPGDEVVLTYRVRVSFQ